MTFFKNTSLADGDALQVYLGQQLVSEGWTEYVLNSTAGAPPAQTRVGRESLFQAPDTAAHPGKHWVGLHRILDVNSSTPGAFKLGLMAFTGCIIKAISSIIRGTPNGATTVEVVTTTAHGMQTGQLPLVNGALNTAFNEPNSPSGTPGSTTETAPNTMTVVDTTTVRFTSIGSGNLSNPGAGGYLVSIFNPASGRCAITNTSGPTACARIACATDGALNVYGYVDALRICGVVVQGTVYKPFYVGLLDRTEHVQEDGSSLGRLTGAVTGDGTTKTLNLDRSCPKLYPGQPLWFVDQGSARPDVAGYQSSYHTTTITAVNSSTQITATVPNGVTYPIGTVVGWDPYPLVAYADGGTTAAAAMNAVSVCCTHDADGTRTTGYIGQLGTTVVNVANEADVDPGADTYYRAYDILVDKATAPTSSRGPMIGFLACSLGAQTTLDIMRGGAAASAPANDWTVFVHATMVPPGSTALCVGPGAV